MVPKGISPGYKINVPKATKTEIFAEENPRRGGDEEGLKQHRGVPGWCCEEDIIIIINGVEHHGEEVESADLHEISLFRLHVHTSKNESGDDLS